MNEIIPPNSKLPLTVFLPETEAESQILPVDLPNVDIVYEDQDLFVINKPAGMPIQPSKSNPDNSLGNALAYLYQCRQEPFVYRCVNRLDRDTSGLTIVAKNALSAGVLYQMVRTRLVKRTYYAIVEDPHNLLPQAGTIELPISREEATDRLHSIKRYIDTKKGAPAITHYKKVTHKDALSLVEFHLETGRTHQIRLHMQAIGYPLIGDFLYNPQNHLMNRQALHAGKLAFPHPITKEPLSFTVPMPADMKGFFEED